MASSQWVKVLFVLFSIQAVHVALAIRYQFNQYWSVTCDPPRRPDNGVYYGSAYGSSKYPIGSRIRFSCNNGYRLEGASWTVCKHFNKRAYWLHPSPVCKPITGCPRLREPNYGSIQVSGNTPGSTALYRCNSGYKLVGLSLRKCYNGRWTGKEPVCQTVEPCGGLGTPLSTSAGRVTCSATRQCPPMYFCHSTDYFSACCPVTTPNPTTTPRSPITVATTTPAPPFIGSGSGSGSGSGDGDDDGDDDLEDQDVTDDLEQIQIIE